MPCPTSYLTSNTEAIASPSPATSSSPQPTLPGFVFRPASGSPRPSKAQVLIFTKEREGSATRPSRNGRLLSLCVLLITPNGISMGNPGAPLPLPNERDKFPGSLPVGGMSLGELFGHQPVFALYADEQANQH